MAGKADGSASARRGKHKRTPLGDGTTTANVNANTPTKELKEESPMKLEKAIPKNESLVGNGTFAVRHTVSSPKNKRVSQISSEAPSENKRNSTISTASTNASQGGRKRKQHVGPWLLGATVGKGGTARVRKVKHKFTGQLGVAKIIPVAVAERARAISLANLVDSAENGDPSLDFGRQIPLGLEREIAIMKLLKHPNIVRLYDVWENRNEIYLIMEYVQGGELFEYVAQRVRLQEDVAVYLFRQIVWALKHCHSLNIHHRDLKPENILLEYETMTVKLVDFGMAALQPDGNFLTTPCGSPHYAAPDLLCNRPYDGSQADVWSAGVVLFVMLTGYPPFNFPSDPQGVVPEDHKLKGLFRAITRADYRMPSALSLEAQDLIRKIFVPDPSKRINIDEVWDHPFVHKYDRIWGLDTLEPSDSMVELAAAQNSWKPLRPKSIDREIFRALRTLWHSESDTALTERLCNNSFNQEKFFYYTMLKYREENLEALQHSQSSFEYSASDYHHSKAPPPVPSLPKTPSQAPSAGRPKSEKSTFSITGDEHVSSKHSYYELPVSEASYDPFRASRSPIVNPKTDYSVTIRRLSSQGGKKHASRATRGNSLRVEVLRKHSRRNSRISSKHSSSSASARRGATGKRSSKSSSSSRMSMASSHLLNSSPMPVMRPSEVHKRGIQFSHTRRSSTGSALSSCADSSLASRTPDHRARALRKLASRRSSSYMTASRPPPIDPIVVRKKGAAVQPTPRTSRLKEHADLEARKVSAELGKVCDEAFWRSSESSSLHATSLQSSSAERPFFETPPSSISRPSPHIGMKETFSISSSVRNRPLPPTPMVTSSTLHPLETPVTYTAREIAEMRDRLAVKYAREGTGNQKYFNDVLRQLDNLMKPMDGEGDGTENRRIVSAPPDCHHLRGSIDLNPLDSIPEEDRPSGSEIGWQRGVRGDQMGGRAKRGRGGDGKAETTIRVVAPSPPPNTFSLKPPHLSSHHTRNLSTSPFSPQPLNIRKNSSSTNNSSISETNDKMGQVVSKLPKAGKVKHTFRSKKHGNRLSSAQYTDDDNAYSLAMSPDYQVGYPEYRTNLLTTTQSNGEAHPGSLLPWGQPSDIHDEDIFEGDSIHNFHYSRHEPEEGDRSRRSITEMYFGSSSQIVADDPLEPPFMRGANSPLSTNPGAFHPTVPSVDEDEISPAAERSPPSVPMFIYPTTIEEEGRRQASAGRANFQHLDDREQSRSARGAPPKEKKGHKIGKYFKKLTGTKNKASAGDGAFSFDDPTSDQFRTLQSIQAHKSHNAQRDMAPTAIPDEQDAKAKKFIGGFMVWMSNKMFVPGVMKPVVRVIAVHAGRPYLWHRMGADILVSESDGWEIIASDHWKYTATIKAHAKNARLRKDVTLDLEVFSISQNNQPVPLSLIRIVQRHGPADCVHIAADWVESWVGRQGLRVSDPDRAADMVQALRQGLQPCLDLPVRNSRDDIYEGTY